MMLILEPEKRKVHFMMEKLKNRIKFDPYFITDIYVYVILGLLPLWFTSGGYTNITKSKFVFVSVTTIIWAAFVIVSAVVKRCRIKMTIDKWLMIAFVICAGISSAVSPFQNHVWMGSGRYNGFVTVLMYGVIYIGMSCFARPRKSYFAVLIVSLCICSVVAIFQLMGKNPLGLFPGDWNYYDKGILYSGEFLGNIGNVDLFGAFLCLALPIAAGISLFSEKVRWIWLLIPIAICFFVGIYMDVKAAEVGLFFSFILLVYAVFKNKKRLNGRRTAIIVIVIILAVGSSQIISFRDYADSDFSVAQTEEDNILGNVISGNITDEMGSSRIGIWRQLIGTYTEYPIIGSGPGTIIDRAYIKFSRYVEETDKTLTTVVDDAHNEFLDKLMCEGALGLAIYIALIAVTCVKVIKRRETERSILLIGMAGYWAQSFFGLSLVLVLPVVYIIWALTNSNGKIEE